MIFLINGIVNTSICSSYVFTTSLTTVVPFSKVIKKHEKTTSPEIARDNMMQLPLKVSMI